MNTHLSDWRAWDAGKNLKVIIEQLFVPQRENRKKKNPLW
jgi:hypothetical protein